ncbi:tRNA lysidine(34) synthetase TilS [Yoonia sp. 2307UL14-13]|uniref:tRNA lysidine(34) synthetase TilS n=1 Tax=Yoonia sp. 2307UL14-13 TaxID=3126506 RepID=UPI0030B00B9E
MSVDDPEIAFRQAIDSVDLEERDQPVILGVSGGGDSIAMMHLAAKSMPRDRILVLTINHGLRAEAAEECEFVGLQAKRLGIRHNTVYWQWDGKGNLQAAARDARFEEMAKWARRWGNPAILLGHTQDDQVETFLMRLGRGSGVDGLASMSPVSERQGVRIVRPLLNVPRAALRNWLRTHRIEWRDDPSNDDQTFDRARARQMLADLSNLGLTRERVLQSVDHMQAARTSLQIAAKDFAQKYVHQDKSDLVFFGEAVDLTSMDLPRRVMAAGLGWIAGQVHRPRFARLIEIVAQVNSGQTATLSGCLLTPEGGGKIRIAREAAAAGGFIGPSENPHDDRDAVWDGRWALKGPVEFGLRVKALGEGIVKCPDWREAGLPRTSLMASPAIWRGDELIAAPIAGLTNGWTARIVADFHDVAFAH